MSMLEHSEIDYYDWIVDGLLQGVQRQQNERTLRKAVATARYINREFVGRVRITIDTAEELRYRCLVANERSEKLIRQSQQLLDEFRVRRDEYVESHDGDGHDGDGHHDYDGDGHHDVRGVLHGHRVQGR